MDDDCGGGGMEGQSGAGGGRIGPRHRAMDGA
jgi:hypothetical protein